MKMTIPPTHLRPANPPSGLQPYSKPQPWGMAPDMMPADVDTADERLWAPVGPDTCTFDPPNTAASPPRARCRSVVSFTCNGVPLLRDSR